MTARISSMQRLSWLSAASLLLLGACGGGDTPDAVPKAVGQMAQRMHVLSASSAADDLRQNMEYASMNNLTVGITVKELFDWAEYQFPDLFPKPAAIPDTPFLYEGVNYTIRGFANGNYLGVTPAGQIFGLGPFTNFELVGFGNAADYAAQVQADRCKVNPGACTPAPPPPAGGALNGCTTTAAAALATGTRFELNWAYTATSPQGGGSGTSKTESVVDGPATFEGLSVIRTSSKTTNVTNTGGMVINSTSDGKEYMQIADNGLVRFIGAETEVATVGVPGGFVTRTKVVYNPPALNSEFTLAVGQSITITETSTVTSTQVAGGFPLPPTVQTTSSTETHTYETRESITVQGRTFDTCRYKLVDPARPAATTTQWFIFGLGFPAKSITIDGPSTTTLELTSGSVNGSPI